MQPSRRSVLLAATAAALTIPATPNAQPAAGRQKILRLQTRQIEVGGKLATRYGVVQPSGAYGLTLDEGDMFDVRLDNALAVSSGVHWHGLNPPWRQDGVPYVSQLPIGPAQSLDYKFPARPAGTRWMHSHFGLQEQNLLAAPLIVRETSAIRSGLQEVVVLLEDFSWTNPRKLYDDLRKAKPDDGGMNMKTNMSAPDLNDIQYDAYLANDRTLADPQVIDVERGAEVRLRIINGSASSNFTIDLGAIEGALVTVDGNPVVPLKASRFPLGTAQRADIIMRMPADGHSAAVLALGEGRTLRTGVVLRPPRASVARISDNADAAGPIVGLEMEKSLRASQPLAVRPVDRSIPIDLIGTMEGYVWQMPVNGMGGLPVRVVRGERVELVMRNRTMMDHPMHLHGHSFQVTEIDGQKFSGAVRDVVVVMPGTTVKVVFDADNPGLWAYHCHNLYHMAAGMFTTVVYEGFA